MIRLLASDIDGTLVEEGCAHPEEELLRIFHELKKKGIYLVVATGRQLRSAERTFKDCASELFFIAENGAVIATSRRILTEKRMDASAVRSLVQKIEERKNLRILFGTAEVSYIKGGDEAYERLMIEGYHNEIEIVDSFEGLYDKALKISVYSENVMEEAGDLLGYDADRLRSVRSGACWIDFTHPEADKGSALREIQESLFVDPEETLVFGDQMNDLEMMMRGRYSYAMEGAPEAVKEAASAIAPSVKEHGVTKVLHTLMAEGLL